MMESPLILDFSDFSSPGSSASPSPAPTLAPRCSVSGPTLAARPVLAIKPVDGAGGSGVNIPSPVSGIVTHKEWVVPPRPKPGRKPATDTPPTKRKAQNRAAQRAFRERRAARVSELEDKLKDVQDEAQERESEKQRTIESLMQQNSTLAKENAACKKEMEELRREVARLTEENAKAKEEKEERLVQVASPAPSVEMADALPVCEIREDPLPTRPAPSAASIPLPRRRKTTTATLGSPGPTCGGCSVKADCACAKSAAATLLSATQAPKRPHSPSSARPKRARKPSYVAEMEVDFTRAFKRATPAPRVQDPCGFCSDGTPCVCAEVANAMDLDESDHEVEMSSEEEAGANITLAPILGHVTPPPSSEEDSSPPPTNARGPKLAPLFPSVTTKAAPGVSKSKSKSQSRCVPGGCDQCKNDPVSAAFCKSIASKVKAGACAGFSTTDFTEIEGPTRTRSAKKRSGTWIKPSEAYRTLAASTGFKESAVREDLGGLVRPLMVRSREGMPQIEISSVRDVLQQLDRRFGKDVKN